MKSFVANLLLIALISALPQTADAKWFGGKKKKAEREAEENVQTFQPPPANAMEMYCEPYRREAAEMYQKAGMFRFLVQPRRSWLIRKHEKCKANLMEQGYQYLRHVDIQQGPSLPKIQSMPATIKPETQIGPVPVEEAPVHDH